MATAISFPLVRTFSIVRVASPRLTRSAVIVASKPRALSSACATPSRPAVASMTRALRCSALTGIIGSCMRLRMDGAGGFLRRFCIRANRSQATLVRGLFSEILHRDLDAIVIHLLVFGLRLLTTLRAAMEKLDHIRNRGTRRPIERVDPRRRAHIDETVEIEVNHVVIQGADIYAPRRLVANAEHFHPVALWGNVFIALPPILKPDAAGCRAAAFEPDALRLRPVSR